ncbi:unnamed protein product [Paramecium octaurelia]|uniref:Uncharacterized protein n=1 Tax=Paramecium octaurelia TaxID=43137 RepID=A0A8S1UE11_PAROT|nr:unnamed protein product [Paramecium octaurelia]
MIELELKCANKHQKPILSVVFDNKHVNNQKLLCHECMETFTEDARIMGFKVVNQMIAESQKQKRDFVEILIENNQKILKSIQLSLVELKSSIIQKLDSLDAITNSWIQNLNNIKSDKAAYSFFEELDKIISYGKEKVSQINKQTIFNEIKETNSLWNEKFKNKLKKFTMFKDYLKCQVILQDLTLQEQVNLPSNQEQFLKIVDTQFKAIKGIFNQYILYTKNEEQYINYFRNEIIKQNPFETQNNECQNIFQLFKRELIENKQFIFINKVEQNLPYLDIFHQTISKKIENSKNSLLDMRQFYSQSIYYDVVSKANIQDYLNNFPIKSFVQSGTFLRNLQTLLDSLHIKYEKTFVFEGDINYVINFDSFQKQQKSIKFDNFVQIDLSGTKISENFKYIYKDLEVIQKCDQSWNNNLKFKQDLLQQYIIISTQIEIKPDQNQDQKSLNYIKSPPSDIPQYIRTNFLQQFNTIMIEQNYWNKLYEELYNLIKQKIEYQSTTSNQQVINDNKDHENISFYNPQIIQSIIQKVQTNIKVKYNNQFAQFGVMLTDIGEKCIFYYSMLITWRFLSRKVESKKEITKLLYQLLV